ncbi:MAG: DUF805 domain-containing protein [Ruminococcus sp.]|nr:DUF805 domain-containing protein [Ruminococcus sp.]
MKCRYCGYNIPYGAKYCEECGANVEEETNSIDLTKTASGQPAANNSDMLDINDPDPRYSYDNSYGQQEQSHGYGPQPFGAPQYGQSNAQQQSYGQFGQPGYGPQNVKIQQYAESSYGHDSLYSGYNTTDGSPRYVGPVDAVKLFFKNYANFSGRSTRSEYWWVVCFEIIFIVIALFIMTFLYRISSTGVTNSNVSGNGKVGGIAAGIFLIFLLLAGLGLVIPGLSLGVRRLHDTGKSGMMYLLCLVPYIGSIILFIIFIFFLMPSDGNNQYGPAADPMRKSGS